MQQCLLFRSETALVVTLRAEEVGRARLRGLSDKRCVSQGSPEKQNQDAQELTGESSHVIMEVKKPHKRLCFGLSLKHPLKTSCIQCGAFGR